MAATGLAPSETRPVVGVGSVKITEMTRRYVEAVLDSGWLSPGRFCARFEREWATLHETRHAIFVNSGTSALQIAVAALKEKHGWRDDSAVLVPAVTFVASVNVILQNGLRPVFVDVDRHYGIDLWGAPPKGSVAVMAVHVNGQQCAMDVVASYAKTHGLIVIEDSCECVAARYHGRMCGTWGAAAAFSTYACHHVTTGVGGFAVTDDPELAITMRSLANHGRDGIKFSESGPTRELIERRFRFERVGFSYRATEMEAAVGCAALIDIQEDLTRRRANADRLNERLADLPIETPHERPGGEWYPMFYPVLTPWRDELEMYLEKHGIETRRVLPLTDQPVYAGLVDEDVFPYARKVNRQGLYVGCHPDADVERIADAFRDFFSLLATHPDNGA